jgi:hypothetical protein
LTIEAKVTLNISDQADEFRIEIFGRFADSAVNDAAAAWKAALLTNTPRRISVDITRMSGYDQAGYLLLRDFCNHGTHIVAGTPRSLFFFTEISARSRSTPASISRSLSEDAPRQSKRGTSNQLLVMPRVAASGE